MALIIGNAASNTLVGTSGSDILIGNSGDDILDGGAGSDQATGGSANDIFLHRIGENVGSSDRYDGGLGQDTLRLALTSAEWARADVQADIAAFLAYQTTALNRFLNPFGFSTPFTFRSTSLTIVNIENLQVTVEGVFLDPRNEAVTARADTLAVTEDRGGTVDLLANDSVPDRAVSVTLLSAGAYGVATLAPSLNGASQSALLSYAPSAAMQALRAGEVVTDTISYRVVDVNGDVSVATVTVTITGVNDAATISGTAAGAVAEDGATAATGRLSVADVDTGESQVVARSGVAGLYGSFSVDAAGAWTYALNNAAANVQALAQNQAVTDSFTVISKDGSASQVVTVSIVGANDAAVIGDPTVASGREDLDVSANGFGYIDLKGRIAISDADQGQAYFVSHSAAAGNLGVLGFQPDGSYTYSVANGAVQYLGAGQTKIDTFTVAAADGTTKQVSFTIIGANDAAVIGDPTVASGREDLDVSANGFGYIDLKGRIAISDADQGQAYFVSHSAAAGNLGVLGFQPDGSYTYSVANGAVQYLGAGQTKIDTFTVAAADGTTKQVSFTIIGANDAAMIGTPTISGVTEDMAIANGALSVSGAIAIADADQGQAYFVSHSATVGNLGALSFQPDGSYTYAVANSAAQYLGAGQTKVDTFTVVAADGTQKTVAFTITGTNDAAVIGDPTVTAVTEDGVVTGGSLTATGTIAVSDVDQNQASFRTTAVGTAGNLGNLTLAAGGAYTYSVANAAVQHLGAGQTKVDSFAITALDGTTKQVAFTVTGTNDAASIGTPTVSSVAEDGPLSGGNLTAAGTIAISDVDQSEGSFRTAVTGASDNLGALLLAADGAYTYSVANSATQFLGASNSKVDTFTVTALDGTTKQVAFTITGANDAAVIGTPTVSSVTEDADVSSGYLIASGAIAISDADQNQAAFQTTVAGAQGNLGSLTLAASGAYSYAVANGGAQSLGAGDTKTDTFTVTSLDGATKQVFFTITGANDAPALATDVTPVHTLSEQTGVTGSTSFFDTALATLAFTDADLSDTHTLGASLLSSSVSNGGTIPTATAAALANALSLVKTDSTATGSGSVKATFGLADNLADFLAAGQTLTATYGVTVADGSGATSTQPVTFTITGTNDLPVIGAPTASAVTEDLDVNAAGNLTAAGTIGITDPDQNQSSFQTIVTAAQGDLGSLALQANGAYTYSVANSAAQYLGAGDAKADTFTVTSLDGATKQVAFTITGANDAPVVTGAVTGSATEDGARVALSALANASDVDAGTTLRVVNVPSSLPPGVTYDTASKSFTLDPAAAAYQSLAAGASTTVSVAYGVSDGTVTTPANVVWTVTGANDAPLAGDDALTAAPSGSGWRLNADNGHYYRLVTTGLNWADADARAKADGAYLATIGDLKENDFVQSLLATSLNWIGGYRDGSNAFRWADGPEAGRFDYTNWYPGEPNNPVTEKALMIYQFGAWNDYTAGTWLPSVQEFGGRPSDAIATGEDTAYGFAGAALLANDTDIDAGDSIAITGFATTTELGAAVTRTGDRFTYDPTGSAALQALARGETTTDRFTYTITDSQAATSTATVRLVVAGANDAPVFTNSAAAASVSLSELAAATGSAAKDSASGTLTFRDVDLSDIHSATQSAPTFALSGGALTTAQASTLTAAGSLALTRSDSTNSGNGSIGYVYSVTDSALDFLAAGQSLTASYNVIVADANGGKAEQTVTIMITGAADGSPTVDLANLGGAGFRIDGAAEYDSAISVASAGDVNGDGFDDLIVGEPYATANNRGYAGLSYVVFGKASGIGNVDLANLGGAGFRIDGAALGNYTGTSVASAGDVNGDGFDDLIVGAPYAGPNGRTFAGSSYVVFGKASGFGTVNLASLGAGGFRIDGAAVNNQVGTSVSSAGDVNGDGFDDLLIGAPGFGAAGRTYVIFGKASGFGTVNLANSLGSAGFTISGAAGSSSSGYSVASAGDVNGDGYDDVIVGAAANPNGRSNAGSSYVVFGKASGFGAVNLGALGSGGFRIDGAAADDQSGLSVASAGDVNGDGFSDVIVGAANADPNGRSDAGSSYVVFGKASGFGTVDLANLGNAGFRIDGVAANDLSGFSVASAGDVNGDGFDDLIVGAKQAGPNGLTSAGSSYVIFGKASGFGNVDLANLGGAGFQIDGAAGDLSGYSVASAGDVNSDGFDDLIIAAPGADSNGRIDAGSSYVVYGGAFGASTAAQTITGTSAGETLRGGAGADTISGLGGNDLLFGGAGTDTFVFTPGAGQDRIADFSAQGAAHDVLDISAYHFASLAAVIAATTTNSGNAVIALNATDSLTLTGVAKSDLSAHPEAFRLA